MIAVDTNVLLRYLLQPLDSRNPSAQNQAAQQLIDGATAVYVADIVLAELEWVLESVFALDRVEIADLVQALAGNTRFNFDDWSALQSALLDYRNHPGVDFSDCLIARRAERRGATTLYTFENRHGLGGLDTATTLSSR